MLLAAAPARAASLALVLAVDVSASVTADSYVLQREGIARAFESARRRSRRSPPRPAASRRWSSQWSDPDKIEVAVGWTRVVDGESAAALSPQPCARRGGAPTG